MSADHFPMPLTADSRAVISSSLSRASRRGSRITVPSRTLVARSRSDSTLRPDNPAARSVSTGVASTRSAVTSSSSAATSRPWMARAAPVASCW